MIKNENKANGHESQDRRFMTEKEVAIRYSLSHRTLQNWRQSGLGPPYVKIGRSVRYPILKTDEWFEQFSFQSTTQYEAIAK
jgi:predicted DNA-binding transcriptional regulator AlpA